MQHWITLNGGKILSFMILALALLEAQAQTLHLSQTLVGWITFAVALGKVAESVFVSPETKAAARVQLQAPAPKDP